MFPCLFQFEKPHTFRGLWPLPPSPKPATSGQVLLMLQSLCFSLPTPAPTSKDSCDYVGLPWIIQDHLPMLRSVGLALAGVAQWIERWPANQRVASSIPSQGTCLGCWPGPQ